jgi:ubiquinone/menaquinone biosynthesis C-methylase UbiE
MIRKALHRIASYGLVYDLIQTVGRIDLVYRRVRRVLGEHPYQTVLDLGGGTGRLQSVLPPDCKYYCLDNEVPKLLRFRSRTKNALAILGDATTTPVAGKSMDVVICMAVSHHLNDSELERMFSEITRILRPEGRLMFYDPLWEPTWLPGKLLWSLDRGSNPRSKETLLNILTRHVRIIHQEEFRMAHEYLLLVASKHEE